MFVLFFCLSLGAAALLFSPSLPLEKLIEKSLSTIFLYVLTPEGQGTEFSFRQTCPAGQVLPKIHLSIRKINWSENEKT